jgi:hypothetical protein
MQDTTAITAEVQVIFKTTLPDTYHVPDMQININTSSGNN